MLDISIAKVLNLLGPEVANCLCFHLKVLNTSTDPPTMCNMSIFESHFHGIKMVTAYFDVAGTTDKCIQMMTLHHRREHYSHSRTISE